MRAGRLRHRVTIKQRTVALNTVGDQVETWTELGKRWALVQQVASTEVTVGTKRYLRGDYAITMRRDDAITTEMRVEWQGKVLGINGIAQDDDRRETVAVSASELEV